MNKTRYRFPTGEMITTGMIAGVLYFVVNLVRFFPHEQLSLMGSGILKINLFIYSFSIWMLGSTGLSALAFAVAYGVALRWGGRITEIIGRFIVYSVVTFCFAAGLTVWTYYARTAPLLARYAIMEGTRNALLLAGAVAAVLSLILSLVMSLGRPHRSSGSRPGMGRLAVIVLCLTYVVLANITGERISGDGDQSGVGDSPGSRIVVLGVDAGSWNVLLPFIEDGALPTLEHFMETGTYGYFDTYGPQFTPPSWASIATGKMLEKHNVYHFGNLSSDWRAAPIWSIMSAAGRSVGVVSWVCTWPPFEVNDFFVSRVMSDIQGRVHVSDRAGPYAAVAESILVRTSHVIPSDDESRLRYVERELQILSGIDDQIVSKLMPEFIAYYFYSPDMVQHFFWNDMDPQLFMSGDWMGEPSNPAYQDVIRDVWIGVDRFLSTLVSEYGEETHYFVVSDHGARPIRRRQATLDFGALLVELGYASLRGGEIHSQSSVCYPSPEWSPHYRFDVKINPAEYMTGTAVEMDRYAAIQSRVIGDLRALTMGGRPIFEWVEGSSEPGGEEDPDIRAFAADVIMEKPQRDVPVMAGDRPISRDMLLKIHPWSGRHRARGILLAKGPAIRHHYTGAWTIDDAYTSLFRYVHGVFKNVDVLAGILSRLHLVDGSTTLDITPTLLYLSGLPVAQDMDGRVLVEIIRDAFVANNPISTIPSYGEGEVLDLKRDGTEDRKITEQLKALGYIQ